MALPYAANAGRGDGDALFEQLRGGADLAGNRLAAERIHEWLESGGAGIELPPPAGDRASAEPAPR